MDIKVKCTCCKKVLVATPSQIKEAQDMGCYFSTCCHAVATVVNVTISSPGLARRR